MIKIHTGREQINKDRFMFDLIRERLDKGRRVILIVPDQFTLQAEKNAFECMNLPGLMDLEVLSFSRLAGRVLSEVGGGLKKFINNYGKYMMISRILLHENENLKVFKDLESSTEFIEKINDFISEIKNHNITDQDLNRIIEKEDDDSLLFRKLEDIQKIYEAYENKMGDQQIDTADYLTLFVSKIKDSAFIRSSEFFISGFDYLSPKNIDAVIEIEKASSSTNMIFTAEAGNSFFKSTNALTEKMRAAALDVGLDAKILDIPAEYAKETAGREALAHIEEQFCTLSQKPYNPVKRDPFAAPDPSAPDHKEDKRSSENPEGQAIDLIAAANFYGEAETAAAKISEFIRDKGMRYKDILVICNDMDIRASVIKRVFSEYGLPVFIDQRRGIHHNPALEYITSLLDITSEGWIPDLVFRFLKTGLTTLSDTEIEELENYTIKFKITGGKWKNEFTHTAGEYSDEEMLQLNKTREHVVTCITEFETTIKNTDSVKDRTSKLFEYLNEKAELPVMIENFRLSLERSGEQEYADEMSQVWPVILNIFDQFVDILGEEILSNEEYAVILKTGFESIQIGMLPPTIDQIILGTMQRTRTGNIKALFILGVNDGVLPLYSSEETLLNEDERDVLYRNGAVICRNDEQIINEEQMAIYRNLSKPSDYLSLSYSVSDIEGGELRPSIVFEKIKKLFPGYQVKKDILNREYDPLDLIQGRGSTANHLTDALRSWVSEESIPEIWGSVFSWFSMNDRELSEKIIKGLAFQNNHEKIGGKYVVDLYKSSYHDEKRPDKEKQNNKKILSSPSAIENFSHCPFSFFLNRGIRLKERRVYELDSRNIGEVYHETLMRFGRIMCDDGRKPLDPLSKWNTYTCDQCTELISEIYDEIEDSYHSGIFRENKYEKYRSNRFKKIITDVAVQIKNHVQSGRIENMFFEAEFARDAEIQPITVETAGGIVEIRGKIDRIDILSQGYAKIIDYKSGANELVKEDITDGWQLQLMLYMKAVTQANGIIGTGNTLKPAGVFYFRIPEPRFKMDGMTLEEISEKVADMMTGEFKMDGLVINNKSVVESITGDLESKYSGIISARKNKEKPEEVSGKAVIDNNEFEELEQAVSGVLTELCEKMLSGYIKAEPKTSHRKVNNNNISACTYCEYRGICSYDKSFDYI